jgi:outer membrane murein-binding lipoprotein Lpp
METKKLDQSVLTHIKELTEKEEQLHSKPDLTDEDVKALHAAKSELDQYWDLLRQRRAFRDAGEDPNRAKMRSSDTIEHYKE